ncbi:MAG: hypothetical protein LQ346_000069 [Caloplaca aetnensis]|nr:MAG: hypothetical protein LQ346_000069 [Caloplaca aetnensis]
MPPHLRTTTRATPANHGSATQLETTPLPHLAPTLRLRADSTDRRRIRWAEDVVDNEGMGKKKSKVCCIYHAPRAVGESSSEDDSSSSSSSGSDPDSGKDDDDDDGGARMSGSGKGRRRRKGEHEHRHRDHEGECEGHSSHGGKPAPARRKGRGNAYETQPKVRGEERSAKA